MAQIKKKFIAADAVDGSKLRLDNNQYLRGRNAADTANIDIVKVNAANALEFASVPEVTADASAANGLVRLSQMQTAISNAVAGVTPKEASRTASTADIDLATGGLLTVGGVTVSAGDRVLVKDQTLPEENGIYIAAAGAWSRATDFDSLTPIDEINGAYTAVQEGTHAGKVFVVSGTVATLGTDPINFVFYNALGALVGGDGITITGNTVDVDLSAVPGLQFNAGELEVLVDPAGAIDLTGTGIAVNLEGTNPTLAITANELGVKIFSGSALEASASGLGVKLEASNPSLQISSNELGVKLDAAGAVVKGASGVKVQLEATNPSLQISSNELGIKLDSTGAIVKDTNGIKVQVESNTLKINGSNQVEGLKTVREIITLSAGDITNQYVTLANTPVQASVRVTPVGGLTQEFGVDFNFPTAVRVGFLGDLATGGAAELIAGDKLIVEYQYL